MGTFGEKTINFGDMTRDPNKNPLEEGARRHVAADENPQQPRPGVGKRQDAGYACPKCEREGKKEVRLFSEPGKFGIICMMNKDHKFDMADLLSMNPTPLKTAAQLAPRQPTASEVTVNLILPIHLAESLKARFGEKLIPTLEAIMNVMCDPDAFMVNGTDAKRLDERMSKKVRSGSALVGEIITLRNELSQLQGQVGSTPTGAAAVGTAMTPTSVIVDLGKWFNKAMEKAKFVGKAVPVWLQENTHTALENDWY